MNVFRWLTGRFSSRGKALSLYKRGMAKAKQQDHQGAIEDYTAILAIDATPTDVKAMVLYNRALVLIATGQPRQGADDLDDVLAMEDAPANVKTMARQKIAKRESQSRKSKA